MRRRDFIAALGGAAAIWPLAARAQPAYPERTVRFIVPYGPSASDTTARMFAERLTARWGKPVVVENRPGGDGLVALNAFVSAHDDHVLYFGPAGVFQVLPYDQESLPFDVRRDLVPIVCVSEVVLAISVPAAMKVATLDDLVALARAQPGTLNAAAANGVSDFLLFGFIKKMGLQIAKVPYREINQGATDLAAGRIQLLATSLAVVEPLANAGRIRILAVTSSQRAPAMPDAPTVEEAGYPALTFESLFGLFGPRGIAEDVRNGIAAAIRSVAEADPAIAKRIADIGTIMSLRGPAEFAEGLQRQSEKLASIAATLGLKAAQ